VALAEHGFRTLDELKELDDTQLSAEARIGLKYCEDLQKKIPRDEMDVWNVCILSGLRLIAGHYECCG
jgi:hypothetical protein